MLRELPFPNMFWPKRLAFLHQIEEIKMKTSGFCFKMSFCWYIFSLESAMTRLVGLAAPWSATIPWPNGHCSILVHVCWETAWTCCALCRKHHEVPQFHGLMDTAAYLSLFVGRQSAWTCCALCRKHHEVPQFHGLMDTAAYFCFWCCFIYSTFGQNMLFETKPFSLRFLVSFSSPLDKTHYEKAASLLTLTHSLPWCYLKMTNKRVKFQILKLFVFVCLLHVKGYASKCTGLKADLL